MATKKDEGDFDLTCFVRSINKDFGEGSLYLMSGERPVDLDVTFRSSGSLLFDVALGGGFPKGRLVALQGKEKSGKTTLATIAVAEAQNKEPDKQNALIDLENTFDPKWAAKCGVNVGKLMVSQPSLGAESIYSLIERLLMSKQFAYVVLDSVASLVSQAELDEEDWAKESRVGGTSKLNAKAMRKLVNSGLLKESGTTLIFINQLRDAIGQFSLYGTPTDAPGGRSIKHNYSQQVDVSVGELFNVGTGANKRTIGQQVKVKVAKNKVGIPYRTAALDIYYDYGVDRITELISVAKELGVLVGTSWLTFIDPATGEMFRDGDKEIKFNGAARAREEIVQDLEKGSGQLYNSIYNVVQRVLRG